jgi:hypothetical protein
MPSAVNEVSTDDFVRACVAFQQAKQQLSAHLNGADVTACDNVSRAVYSLANKAMVQQQKRPVRRGRVSLKQLVLQAVRGRTLFTAQIILDQLTQQKVLPKYKNARGNIHALLSAEKKLFERVSLGTYRLKKPAKRLVFADKKTPKQLPARTT